MMLIIAVFVAGAQFVEDLCKYALMGSSGTMAQQKIVVRGLNSHLHLMEIALLYQWLEISIQL
jgi:hypothetical protein